jgi:GGDEF domain-containing protein
VPSFRPGGRISARAQIVEGVAQGENQLIDDLIGTSDAAMHEAKRAGGNQVCHYPALVPPGGR